MFRPNRTSPFCHSNARGHPLIRNRERMGALVVLALCTTLFGFSLTGSYPSLAETASTKSRDVHMLLVSSGADRYAVG